MRTGIAIATASLITAIGCPAHALFWPEAYSPPFVLDTAVHIADTDGDRMPDAWELAHGLNPEADDRSANPDGDPYTNVDEYNAGLDPQVAEPPGLPYATCGNFPLSLREVAFDSDADGMPDEWESAHGLDPASDDAALDPDQDGMSNEEEYNGGWDPQAPEIAAKGRCTSAVATVDTGACLFGFGTDTDGDGMPDWWEIKYGLKRLLDDADADLDHDGLSNLTEYRLGTLPNGDGLSDMVWAMSLEFLLDTIGISPDTDGDGMRDWWEIAHGLNHLVDDSGLDPDEDGWTNLEEYNANTDPHVDDCLGPSMAASLDFLTDTGGFNGGYADDMDGDGMPDWWEIKYNLLPTVNDSAGNPDGDALNNLEEYNAGTNPRAFDFLLVEDAEGNLFVLDTGGRYYDADGDGMPNWWERLYCGSVTNMEAETDSDGDGYSNLAEYISRCSPTNRCSVFAAQDAKASESGEDWVVWWDTAPDRIYSVYSHTNLLTRWPADPIYEVQGDGQPKCYTNAVHGTVPRFFRIGVRLAPHP